MVHRPKVGHGHVDTHEDFHDITGRALSIWAQRQFLEMREGTKRKQKERTGCVFHRLFLERCGAGIVAKPASQLTTGWFWTFFGVAWRWGAISGIRPGSGAAEERKQKETTRREQQHIVFSVAFLFCGRFAASTVLFLRFGPVCRGCPISQV